MRDIVITGDFNEHYTYTKIGEDKYATEDATLTRKAMEWQIYNCMMMGWTANIDGQEFDRLEQYEAYILNKKAVN